MRLPRVWVLTHLVILVFGCPNERFCPRCAPSPDACDFCHTGFLNADAACDTIHLQPLRGCATYHWDPDPVPTYPKCLQCEIGFGLDVASGTCFPCEGKHCAQCDEGLCTACFENRRLVFYPGEEISSECALESRCDFRNCEICGQISPGARQRCLKCVPGFVLTEDSFSGCVKAQVDNCHAVSMRDRDRCMWCASGFHLTSRGTCKRDPDRSLGLSVALYTSFVDTAMLLYLGVLVIEGRRVPRGRASQEALVGRTGSV